MVGGGFGGLPCGWLEVGLVRFPVGGGLPQYGQQGRGASLEQRSMEDELW